MTIKARLYFPEFRRNSVFYGTFLLYPVELRYPMPPENGNVKKELQRNVVSTSAKLIYIRTSYVGLPLNLPSYTSGIGCQGGGGYEALKC